MKIAIMNTGTTGSATLQIPNPKQHYYGGPPTSNSSSSGNGSINTNNAHQHQHQSLSTFSMNSMQNQMHNLHPINLHSQSQNPNQHQSHGSSTGQQNGNPHSHIRVPAHTSTSSASGNPINMSIPVTIHSSITQQHQPHNQQQFQGSSDNGLNLNDHSSNNNFRNQSITLDLPDGAQEFASLIQFPSDAQLEHSSNGNNMNENSATSQNQSQSQQQHSIIVNLGNLLDINIDDRPHVCQVCQATYKTRTHLRRHMLVHMQNRPYPCADCSKGFNRKEHLNKHIEAVHSGTRYKCHLCGKEISRKDHLARHIKNMHNSDLNDPMVQAQLNPITLGSHPQKKPVRNRSSQDANSLCLSENEEGVHFMIGELSSSDIVDKLSPEKVPKTQSQYNTSGESLIDQLKFNPSDFFVTSPTGTANKKINQLFNQLYTCLECQSTFTLEKDFNTHLRGHKEKPQPYKCDQCPRAYTRREKLMEHVRCFHEGQKFSCEYCEKQLSRKDHILRHVRSVHPEVLANRFISITENGAIDCAGNGSNRIGGLSSGNSSSQGSNSNIPSMGSMGDMGVLLRSVCHVCLKVFGTSYHLQRHCESCHNGNNRPFSCNLCKKQFKRKDHLTKHLKAHCPSMKDATKTPRGSGSRKSKSASRRAAIDSELSTIDQETINSLQIEMTTPDEDVEVAIAIVNTTNNGTNAANSTLSTPNSSATTNTTTKFLRNPSLSPGNRIIQPSSTSTSSNLSITATTMNPKLPNSSSTYTRNLQEIINNTSNKYRPAAVIARKSSAGSSSKFDKSSASLIMAARTTADFTCGHCGAKFPTKEKMIQHLQTHPSTSTSPASTQEAARATNIATSTSIQGINSPHSTPTPGIGTASSSSSQSTMSAMEGIELPSISTSNSTVTTTSVTSTPLPGQNPGTPDSSGTGHIKPSIFSLTWI